MTSSLQPQLVFVDSSIWIAQFRAIDIHHERAIHLFQEEVSEAQLITSNLVVYEVLTVLSMRTGKVGAQKFGDFIFQKTQTQANLQYVVVDEVIEQKVWKLFQTVGKKDISFVDCSSVVIAKDWGAKAIMSFDQHFKIFKTKFGLDILG